MKKLIYLFLLFGGGSLLFANNNTFLNTSNANSTYSYEIYVKYKNFPSKIYLHQRLVFDVEVLILNDYKYNDFNISYENGNDFEIIDDEQKWQSNDSHTYIKQFIFKVKSTSFKMPIIKLVAQHNAHNIITKYISVFDLNQTNNSQDYIAQSYAKNVNLDNLLEINKYFISITNTTNLTNESNTSHDNAQLPLQTNLMPPQMELVKINKEHYFSNVIANLIEVEQLHVEQYNNNNYKVTLMLLGQNSNLEDFYLEEFGSFQKQIYLETNHIKQYLIYEFLAPISTKNIKFSYYCPTTNKFESLNIPIVVEQGIISKQEDISPHIYNDMYYEKAIILLGAIFFFVLFYWTRHIIFIFIGGVISLYLLFVIVRLFTSEVELKVGSSVFVLPTTNSFAYDELENTTKVKVILKQKQWSKVLIDDEKIGWVKNEDIKNN